ncbi:mRNA 3' end processing factor [Coemansia biformis]|uniref:mRNA 3' end processing factor n=1 Tax=Coemansia biformis TaxID=1286918 RepID=A0A9W7YB31_9FUNG|nr:mRNA 3' end processing factor [Coemansia biformis]
MSDPQRINWTLYRELRNDLSKLTFNSKPIINDLSKKAEAHVDEAETVLKAVEEHLRFTVPKLKLPTFYLLDSIAKNVGGMYVSLLHGRVGKIFVDVWQSTDDEVKAKLERTLGTWRNGFEGGGRNLFPEFVLRKIDEDIARLKARAKETVSMVPEPDSNDLLDSLAGMQTYAKKRAREEQQLAMRRAMAAKADSYGGAADYRGSQERRPPSHMDKRPRAGDQPKVSLLQLVNEILLKKKVELLRRPNDVMLFTVLNTLKEIKAAVAETELPPERIDELRQQLAALDSAQQGNGGPATPPQPPPEANGQAAAAPGPTSKAAGAGQLLQSIMARPDLMSSLSKVVPGLSLSRGATAAPPAQQRAMADDYKDLAQVEPIPLSHASITRSRPGIFNILYAGYANQCSQCGWRTKGQAGQLMKKHMDWHFRRNMREQNSKDRRAMARGWYLDQAHWEAGEATAEDQPAAPAAGTPGAEGPAGGDEEAIAELKRKTVPAAGGPSDPCAICKEAFVRRFNEDDEGWELVNAVVVDGVVLHATCDAGSR